MLDLWREYEYMKEEIDSAIKISFFPPLQGEGQGGDGESMLKGFDNHTALPYD